MPQAELLEFFRANTQDLPEITSGWYKLPNPFSEEFRGRPYTMAESTRRFLQEQDQRIVDLFADQGGEAVIRYATEQLELAPQHFDSDQLTYVRGRLLENRVGAQGSLFRVEDETYSTYGPQVRAYYELSAAADLMRWDSEIGIASHIDTVIDHFDFAGMAQVGLKVIEKKLGRPWERDWEGEPVLLEIREMERATLALLEAVPPQQGVNS